MTLIPFSTKELAECRKGLIAKMIDKELSRMAQDIFSAWEHPAPRTVTIKIIQKPVLRDGELHSVNTQISVNGRTPERAAGMDMFIRRDARQMFFVYSPESEENAAQMGLPFQPPREQDEPARDVE